MKHVLTPLTKNVLAPLEIMAVAQVINAAIREKMSVFRTATLIFSNEESNNII